MSTTVDQRVVEMRFDNRNFERNVQTSMSTLDKLKQSLELKGATKGFEDVDAAANKVNLSPLSKSIQTVGLKFNGLYTMADQALRNITNSAMNAGKKIVSALAIDPIKTGFQEYETQINSVQTILANTESKGSTLQDVNTALAELNTYADKTIYNFTEMTRNIGTFTAAGVDLDTSVAAIKGIANLAAVSGSTSQQASTAMYQLSQALSSGTVKLMDWNSVVNAGMGGQVFQDSLKETARVHGIQIDAMIEKEGSFRETLKGEWLTSEILTETLSKFTGDLSEAQLKSMGYTDEQIKGIIRLGNTANDAATKVKTFTQLFDTLKEAAQSGWTKSWELLIGDFGEAKDLLTDISDLVGGVIGDSSDQRNEVLMGGLSTGWKQLLNEGINDAAGFEEMVSSVAKEHGVNLADMIDDEHSFQDVLKQSMKDGKLTGDVLSESISKFSEKVSNMSAEELEAAGYTKQHIEQLKKLDENVKNGTVSMDEFTKLIVRPSGRELLIESLWNSIKGIQSVLAPIKQAFEEVFEPFTGDNLYSIIESIRDFTSMLKLNEEQSEALKNTFKGLFSVLKVAVNIIKTVVSGALQLVGAILPIGNGLLSVLGSLGKFLFGVTDAVDGMGLLTGIFKGTATVIRWFADGINNALTTLAGGINKCGSVGENVGKLGDKIKNLFGKLKPLIDKLGELFGKIKPLFDKIQITTSGESIIDTLLKVITGGSIAAIGVSLAKFIKMLNTFGNSANGFLEKWAKLPEKLLDGINNVFNGLKNICDAYASSIKAETLKKIAVAVAILAASLLVLSLIDPVRLATALAAMTVLIAELMGALAIFGKIIEGKKFKGITKVTFALIGLSAAISILSVALKIMSTMSWSEMGVGLISLTVGLGALIGAVNLLPEKKVNKAAKAIKKLTSAILIYAVALKIMSTMSWREMGVGLISTVAGLGALVATLHLLPKDTSAKVSKLLALVIALGLLSVVLKTMGSMSWKEMAIGLGGLIIGLGALVGMLHLLPKNSAAKVGNLLILSAAIIVLGRALKNISSIPWQQMIVGIGGMAASLAILIAALYLIPSSAALQAASILILSTAMIALGVALKLIGSLSIATIAKGLGAIAAVFIILGVAGYALSYAVPAILGIAAAVAILGVGCVAAGAGLVLMSAGLTALAAAIVGSVDIILSGTNKLIGVFTTIILSLVAAIVTCVPAIKLAILRVLIGVLTGLVQYVPQIVGLIFDFLINIINTLATKLPQLIDASVGLLMAYYQGIADAIDKVDPKVILKGLVGIGILAAMMYALTLISSMVPSAMMGILGLGLIVTELSLVLAGLGKLYQIQGLQKLMSDGGNFLQAIGTAIGKFVGGIAGGYAQGFSAVLPKIGKDLSAFMSAVQPFIDGVKQIDASTMTGVKSLVGVIFAITAAEVYDSMTSWITGGSSLKDFGKQISSLGPYLRIFAEDMSGVDAGAIKASVEAIKALGEMAQALPNSGGVAGFFAGENDIGSFGPQLIPFGEGLRGYSESVSGMNVEAVIASVEAAKALAEMASMVPNEGGVAAWFTGDNSLSKFGPDLIELGKGLRGFSEETANIIPENIIAATNAAKALAEMASVVPNEGGMTSWFAGDNSLSKFGPDLILLGKGLKGFSDRTNGIIPENIIAAANAAKALAEITDAIPNEGGMVAWFTGDNSLSKFGMDLIELGKGLKGFSDETKGVVSENIIAAANAAKALAEMANMVPNEGGMVAWFTGDNSLSKFGPELVELGKGLKGFSDETKGVVSKNITAAAGAAKVLAEMASIVPNEGGMVAWFTGDNSLSNFGPELVELGKGLKGFSDETKGIIPENIIGAANAAKTLAEITNALPNSGGVVSWFTGDNSLSKFGTDLIKLGAGLKGFSDSTVNIKPENVTAAAGAAKALAEITNMLPNSGGVVSWFTGDNSLSKFGTDLIELGKGLKGFSDETADIVPENVTAAAGAAKALAEITNMLPNSGGVVSWFTGDNSLSKFGTDLIELGKGLKGFSDETADIVPENVTAAAGAAKALAEITTIIPNSDGIAAWFTGEASLSKFGEDVVKFGGCLKGFSESINGIKPADISAAASAAKSLAELGNSGLAEDPGKLPEIGRAMEEFGAQIKSFSYKMQELKNDTLTNAISKFKDVKTLINEIAESHINTFNSDKLPDFGRDLEEFAAQIKSFAYKLAELDKNTLNEGFEKLKSIPKNIEEIGTVDVQPLKSFCDALKNSGVEGIKGFVSALAAPNKSANEAVNNLMTSIVSVVDSYKAEGSKLYTSFYNVGSYAVDGFAKGITDNKAKATEAGTKLGNYALKAAKEAIDSNSPSREFMKVGGYVVAGFAKGITDDLGDVKDVAHTLGDTMLKSTQAELGIHSPSIVFEKEVGMWIVKGIAEGIKKDMSAEEAAEKKASNIVAAFSKKLNEYSLDSDIASKALDLWSIQNGDMSTQAEKDAKTLEYLNADLARKKEVEKLAHDEWQETKKYYEKGEVELKAVKESESRYYDAMIEVAEIQEKIKDIDFGNAAKESRTNELERAMEVRSMLQENWLKTNGRYTSTEDMYSRILADAKADVENLNELYEIACVKHEYAVSHYAADSEEVNDAYDSMIEVENKRADKIAEVASVEKNVSQNQLDVIDARVQYRDNLYELNKSELGNNASEDTLDALEVARLNEHLEDYKKQRDIEKQQWLDIKKAYEEGAAAIEEVEKAHDEYIQSCIRVTNTENDIDQILENAAERKRDSLEEQYKLASESADLRYQIWEATVGRDATSMQKNATKVSMLSEQLVHQSSLMNQAKQEWLDAAKDHTKTANEVQEAYNAYLQQQLAVANLQNEITDINEQTALRQKNAASEYKKYIDKYEKYYLMNGMTKADLERDAKLISGYDGNSTVNNMMSSMSNALDNITKSSGYQDNIEKFSNLGTSYVDAVNEGVTETSNVVVDSITEMMGRCLSNITDSKQDWIDAGSQLVAGFVSGIRSRIVEAAAAARIMAYSAVNAVRLELDINSPSRVFAGFGMFAAMGFAKGLHDNAVLSDVAAADLGQSAIDNLKSTIQRISEVVNSDMDTQPTIRPVLDLSNVEAGTARLNSMFSRSQALKVSAGMNKDYVDGNQNGVNASSDGGNTYNFTQNNYSPKSLSTTEIYRNTKNQFTAMKGALT